MKVSDLLEDFYNMSQSLWHVSLPWNVEKAYKNGFRTSPLSDKSELEAVVHALHPHLNIKSEEFARLVDDFEYSRFVSFSKRSLNDYSDMFAENHVTFANIEFYKARIIKDYDFIDIDYMRYRREKEGINNKEDATEFRLLTNEPTINIVNDDYVKAIHFYCHYKSAELRKIFKGTKFPMYLYGSLSDALRISSDRKRIR